MNSIFEKLGIFYLGRDLDPGTMQATDTPTLVKSKNFTTHAAIIGMTGSGKTGLGIDLLEEAAIDNIPVIAIDPKGDMGNLCLAFENLTPEDFLPWVEEEAHQKGENPEAYAKKIAEMWKNGIESFDQTPERIRRFKAHDTTIYTPGSEAGIPVNVLGSLNVPDRTILEDADALASAIGSTVSSLLALIGIEADPLESREYILIAQILKKGWREEASMDIGTLISQIINPPFSRIGVLPLESFYPPQERFKLASRFNNVLASPTFENWLKGDALDIDALMYDEKGKSKIAIFSIAHLGDAERMFFVTLLLNKILGWMRRQSGTNRLRALVYMDEIYGYFPPSKNPPSKTPMMLMLKQARAFGVGMVLSTQNPVDLDYKGLSNIGIWYIGKLQTRQDIAKVVDGLAGQAEEEFDKKRISDIIRTLPKRTFFLKSAHMPGIRLFQTRWVLSYLKGPMKKQDIARCMASKKRKKESAKTQTLHRPHFSPAESSTARPILSSNIPQTFDIPASDGGLYTPWLHLKAEVRYFNASRGIDEKEEICLHLPLEESDEGCDFERAESCETDPATLPKSPAKSCDFAALPSFVANARSLKSVEKAFSDRLYAQKRLTLYRCRPLKAESEPRESLERFKQRLQEILEEKRSAAAEKLQTRYAKKLQTLESRRQRALQRLQKEREDVSSKTTESLIDAGLAIFGSLFGSKRSAASKVGQVLKKGRHVLDEKADVQRAQEALNAIEERIEALKTELEEKLDELDEKFSVEAYPIDTFFIKPRRSDIRLEPALLWWRCS
ncbi:helicase HerA domain-containing protein [Hydrogenimonas urashimensis]|uniref:helicase HerA domain-containing protein n=1 Tax=Hydrogenimonas urashimensis TaxID=2740515 RepID=UPI0019160773|nr:DUF87 domain-containing protein [Hydrogenimonas urashimensis]